MGIGSFIDCTVQPVLKSKNISTERRKPASGSSEWQYLFFGPCLYPCPQWSALGLDNRMVIVTGWALGARGSSLSFMSCWWAGRTLSEVRESFGFPKPDVSVSEGCDRPSYSSSLGLGDLVLKMSLKRMIPPQQPRRIH